MKAYALRMVGVCLLISSGVWAEPAPPEVVEAARIGLLPFLNVHPPGELQKLGFAPNDMIEKAYVGDPVMLYTITPADLFNATPETPIRSLMTPTGHWFFPVMVGGEARSILTVRRLDGSWKAVEIGAAPMARELQKVRRLWPKSKGYDPLLIAVYQASAHFFTVPQKDDHNLTPLTFGGKEFGAEFYKEGQSYVSTVEFSRIIGELKRVVEENIRKYNF